MKKYIERFIKIEKERDSKAAIVNKLRNELSDLYDELLEMGEELFPDIIFEHYYEILIAMKLTYYKKCTNEEIKEYLKIFRNNRIKRLHQMEDL